MPSPKPPEALGRLGAFTLLGAAAGSVPLPWVPAALARRVRGALVQDVAGRHGLSLSPEARTVLEEPSPSKRRNRATREAMRYLAVRMLGRFGPARLLSPVRTALDTFVLGHLFARYLSSRRDLTLRIEQDEAETLRNLIDRALLQTLTSGVELEPLPLLAAPEELRDEVTRAVDGVLIATATVPSWLMRRLDAAFDELLANP
jgi:hypothetical protein